MTRIAIAGDWHGYTEAAVRGCNHAMLNGADALIHVGDFGYNFSSEFVSTISNCPFKTYFIRGNHDNTDYLKSFAVPGTYEPVEIQPNLIYMPDGSQMKFDGMNFVFFGVPTALTVAHVSLERLGGRTRSRLWTPSGTLMRPTLRLRS